jgi:hypothetical protein
MKPVDHTGVERIYHLLKENRFLVLLIFLLFFIVIGPYLTEGTGDKVVQATLVSLVLLGAFDCLQFRRRGMLTTRWFGVITLLTGWVPIFSVHPWLVAAVNAIRICFFIIVTGALIYQVAKSAKVTVPLIIGAIDGYLMLGIVGAGAFAIVEGLIPGSVKFPAGMSSTTDFIYFSFITMLTIGYGDVVPVGITAQTIAVFLGVAGQFYIAVLMSMLVGKFLATNQRTEPGT